MLSPQHTLIAVALFVAPAAIGYAEPPETLEVTLTYDAESFNTAEGTDETLASLVKQAHAACEYRAPISNAPRSDEACEDAVLARAISSISNSSLNGAYRLATQGVSPHLTATYSSEITNE